MQSLTDQIIVVEHEITTLRGLRLSSNTGVALAAVARQQEREKELEALRREAAMHPATVPADEDGLPMAASQQAKGSR